MRMTKLASALALAVGLPLAAQAAQITLSTDGIKSPFGGFDWLSTAPAYVEGVTFTPGAAAGTTSNTFSLYYFSTATAVQSETGTFFTPNLYPVGDNNAPAGTYEITHITNLQETAVCSIAADASGLCQGELTFSLVSGDWKIWLDESPNAFYGDGTGFNDGTEILAGNWTSTSGSFDATTGSGNQLDLLGTVQSTNSAYITPDMVGTNASSTLQLFGGSQQTAVVNPGQFPLLGGGFADVDLATAGNALFQADANQGFSAVPVPGSLALLASALIGMGVATRKSSKK